MGQATLTDVRSEFERRVNGGEFIGVEQKTGRPGRVFTTQEMVDYERDTIQFMREGQNKHAALASFDTRRECVSRLALIDQLRLLIVMRRLRWASSTVLSDSRTGMGPLRRDLLRA
jgi:hypothetical protein